MNYKINGNVIYSFQNRTEKNKGFHKNLSIQQEHEEREGEKKK